jgi:hypothetical protein
LEKYAANGDIDAKAESIAQSHAVNLTSNAGTGKVEIHQHSAAFLLPACSGAQFALAILRQR